MKTKRFLATILAVLVLAIASAVEKPKMNVQTLSSNQILLTIKNEKSCDTQVSISDKNGNIVYYKLSSKPIDSYNKIFNFENLENGNYELQVQTNGAMLKRTLTISSNKISIGNAEEYATPYFSLNNNLLNITHLNFENKKYRVQIYNDKGLAFETKTNNDSPLHSAFDLSQLESGNYTVVLNSGKSKFNYHFEY